MNNEIQLDFDFINEISNLKDVKFVYKKIKNIHAKGLQTQNFTINERTFAFVFKDFKDSWSVTKMIFNADGSLNCFNSYAGLSMDWDDVNNTLLPQKSLLDCEFIAHRELEHLERDEYVKFPKQTEWLEKRYNNEK